MENTKDYELARLYFKKLKCDVDIANYEHKTLEEFWTKIQRGYNDRKLWLNKSNITKRFREFFLLNKKNKEKLAFI